ncbi:TenA family transcriptional regulator [Nonomuraea sp. K274]|uniref:TenA family transcriptional regulator n=1 Tax=Nonomuraea cypriaca TaxID=1187855 RepID=A0A931ADS1_9ACTN|nr:TenA family transcriptional regulator [Nonomuraea cypriaca]MBF8190901.1 TenA family transcriptional regulator [Nonomuraea cypriaca]
MTLRAELSAIAEPLVAKVMEHPFWTGLREGTLPPSSLWYFAEQDARHVVPAYARALARCAGIAERDEHGELLCSAATATFGSLPKLAAGLSGLAAGQSPAGPDGTVARPVVHAYASFMLAGSTVSFATGIVSLLPMTWFHLFVSNDLQKRCDPRSRYASWVEQYPPGGDYEGYVNAFLAMVDEMGAQCSAADRSRLVDRFLVGARYEWAFAEAAWQRQEWAV